ncbi:MAG: protein kinase [Acidobacteria bacterium]|nr:protein kinase [Acidobacteriota bacterium]
MPELKLENSLVDGRFEVRERLNRGSYAEIYVARDRAAGGMDVVIKALNTSLQGTPDADLERTLVENFQNEAVALDAVRHSNVILRLGHGTAADLRSVPFHYLVLEYLPGGDLLKLCRGKSESRLSLDEALFFFKQACEGLAYAHSKGIIHRDLKPNNLLLTEDHRTLKIADFGVAKFTSGEDIEITRVGADIYAPPEHNPHDNSGQVERLTESADVYSLAKSFYTVICGRAPSQFKCDPITSLPEPLMIKPWARPLIAILQRATDDSPAVRHATMVEFWNELVQIASIRVDEIDSESSEEETLVRPRLKVVPGSLPQTPLQPEFEPALASSATSGHFNPATPVAARQKRESNIIAPVQPQPEMEKADENHSAKKGRFFIELQQPKPSTPIQPLPKTEPPAVRTSVRSSVTPEPAKAVKAPIKSLTTPVKDRFTEGVRRRVFLILLALAFLGVLGSVYNYFRNLGHPFGFGPPTEIEIVSVGLNVRYGPSMRDSVMGVIAKGSRHKVMTQTSQQWYQIEVGQWDETNPHVQDQNRGWVYGSSDFVRVVSRRVW